MVWGPCQSEGCWFKYMFNTESLRDGLRKLLDTNEQDSNGNFTMGCAWPSHKPRWIFTAVHYVMTIDKQVLVRIDDDQCKDNLPPFDTGKRDSFSIDPEIWKIAILRTPHRLMIKTCNRVFAMTSRLSTIMSFIKPSSSCEHCLHLSYFFWISKHRWEILQDVGTIKRVAIICRGSWGRGSVLTLECKNILRVERGLYYSWTTARWYTAVGRVKLRNVV